MAYNISDFYEKLHKLETMHQEKLKHFKEEFAHVDKSMHEKAEAS